MMDRTDNLVADIGIQFANAASHSILNVSEGSWKTQPSAETSVVADSIVLAGTLFGSIYLFSTSLAGWNKKLIRDEDAPFSTCEVMNGPFSTFEVMNGSVMIATGVILFATTQRAFRIMCRK